MKFLLEELTAYAIHQSLILQGAYSYGMLK